MEYLSFFAEELSAFWNNPGKTLKRIIIQWSYLF